MYSALVKQFLHRNRPFRDLEEHLGLEQPFLQLFIVKILVFVLLNGGDDDVYDGGDRVGPNLVPHYFFPAPYSHQASHHSMLRSRNIFHPLCHRISNGHCSMDHHMEEATYASGAKPLQKESSDRGRDLLLCDFVSYLYYIYKILYTISNAII